MIRMPIRITSYLQMRLPGNTCGIRHQRNALPQLLASDQHMSALPHVAAMACACPLSASGPLWQNKAAVGRLLVGGLPVVTFLKRKAP